jgi:hypothetical protein
MSETKTTINTFQKGMHTGLDKSQESKQSYLDSFNGRIIYNEDGTYAWENANGTKLVLTISVNHANPLVPYPPIPGGAMPPYIIIGQCTVNGQCVVLLTNNWWSEIGVISQPQFGRFSYETIYNDYNDPNGPIPVGANAGQGRLQLKTAWNAKMLGIVENEHTTRVYWDDDYNEPRTINIIPPSGTVWSTLPYPVWHSAHQINSMPDLTWGLVKYQHDISGALISGKRQYAYRYIGKSGYVSPWSALTAHIQCTAQDRSITDWNQYFMSSAGSATTKGHLFEIKGLDQRFQQIEVAALYWATDIAPLNGIIFSKVDIPQTGPATVLVQHTVDIGQIITAESLIQRYFEIQNAKTDAITGDNYLHKANIDLYAEPQIASTAGIVCCPILKKMISDTTGIGNGNPDPTLNPISALPFTNQIPISDTTTRNMFFGGSGTMYQEIYEVGSVGHEDYTNYKGTQWEHLYKSKMRQDTYPFALVLFDRKGQPSWAQHITDYTFPAQFNNIFSDARLSGTTSGTTPYSVGDFRLTDTPFSVNGIPQPPYVSGDPILDNTIQGANICPIIMGIQFGNIDLTDILFDQYGDLQVSGFAIVQMPRLGAVIGQGVILNTTKYIDNAGHDTKETHPLVTGYNWYEQLGIGYARTAGKLSDGEPIQVMPYAFTFECPDAFFDPTIFGTSLSADTIVPIGIVAPYNLKTGDFTVIPDSGPDTGVSPDQFVGCAGSLQTYTAYPHFFNKHYISLPNSLPFPGSIDSNPELNNPAYTANNAFFGVPYSVNDLYVQARNVPGYQGSQGYNYYEIGTQQDYYPVDYQTFSASRKVYTGRAHSDTMLLVSDAAMGSVAGTPNTGLKTASLRVKDWTGNTGNFCHTPYYLMNYMRSVGAYTITQSWLDNRIYNNIGHFIPINKDTLAIALNPTTQRYTFSDIEVYYGDTYVDFFCYDRIEPAYFNQAIGTQTSPDCSTANYPDYAIGMAFCVESVYNHTMRAGITFPRYGTDPMSTYCNPNSTIVNADGIWYFDDALKQSEDFLIAAVCNAADTANQYTSLQACFGEVNNNFPLMEIYSNQKVYGECYDSFRQFLTTKSQFAQGQYGEITEMAYMGGYNSIYMLQRYGFSRILFNERTGIAAGGGELLTAIANGYQGHQYLSIKDGCQHQWSVVNTGKALYWTDAEKGKLNRFAQDGVEAYSDKFDYHDNINKWTRDYWLVIDRGGTLTGGNPRYYDNPTFLGGIHSVFDSENESIYTTFTTRLEDSTRSGVVTVGDPHTVEFSAKLSQFQSRHGFYPTMYFDLKQSFFSQMPISTATIIPTIYMHNEGIKGQIYGVNQVSTLKFVSNPEILRANYFDNAEIGVETLAGASKINSVNLVTPITAAQSITLNDPTVDTRPKFEEGFLRYPMRELTNRARILGKYCVQEYEIGNDGSDTIVRITDVQTKYRESNRA